CERGGITADILPAASGDNLAPAQPPLERRSKNVHRKKSSVRCDFELLRQGSGAGGGSKERQRRGRREAQDRCQGRCSRKEGRQKVIVEEDTRIVIAAADRSARRELIDQLYPMAKTTDKDRKTIEGIQTALKAAREQWKKDAGKPNTTKIPDDIVKAADELQKKVDAVAEKFIREREGLGNAGPPFQWKPDPLPNQVQNLLDDLDGFTA